MSLNVLIVDDEPYCVEILKKQINWQDFGQVQLYGAYSAVKAKNILKAQPIELLLCDIEMPGESGLDLIEYERENCRLEGKATECLILTCHPEYDYMRRAMQLGCADYILKPFQFDELQQVLAKAVTRIEEGRQQAAREAKALKILTESEDTPSAHIIHDKIIPYIHENISLPFSVSDIAGYAALNPQYLMRLFKKTMSCSIIEYVTGYKVELAKQMLINQNWTVEKIAGELAYLNTTYFNRVFKQHTSMTPSEFRETYGIQ